MTGSTLYRQNCSGCHRLDRKGSPPEFPSLENIGSRLTADQVREMALQGGGRMPGFAHIGDGAVNAIVDYLISGKDVRVDGAEHPKTTTFSPLKYGIDGYNRWLDPGWLSGGCTALGTPNAINLNTTKKYVWKKPFGEFPALAAQGIRDTGSENYGGGVLSPPAALFFIAATSHDSKIRAFDKANGESSLGSDAACGGECDPGSIRSERS